VTGAEPSFAAKRGRNFGKELAQKGWYPSIEFPDGSVTDGLIPLQRLKERVGHMPIADADVDAVDCVEIQNFLAAHEARSLKFELQNT